jgi:anti-sigma regulatory factor (Ser/Thr protein kinase)
MPTRTFPGRYECLAEIEEFVYQIIVKVGFSAAQVYEIRLAVDEACTNIIEHGYGGEGLGDITCTCESTGDSVTIIVKDWGSRFEPDEIPEPDYAVPLEELQSRGTGLYLMRKLMDEVDFKFSDRDGNTLTMKKSK